MPTKQACEHADELVALALAELVVCAAGAEDLRSLSERSDLSRALDRACEVAVRERASVLKSGGRRSEGVSQRKKFGGRRPSTSRPQRRVSRCLRFGDAGATPRNVPRTTRSCGRNSRMMATASRREAYHWEGLRC